MRKALFEIHGFDSLRLTLILKISIFKETANKPQNEHAEEAHGIQTKQEKKKPMNLPRMLVNDLATNEQECAGWKC